MFKDVSYVDSMYILDYTLIRPHLEKAIDETVSVLRDGYVSNVAYNEMLSLRKNILTSALVKTIEDCTDAVLYSSTAGDFITTLNATATKVLSQIEKISTLLYPICFDTFKLDNVNEIYLDVVLIGSNMHVHMCKHTGV